MDKEEFRKLLTRRHERHLDENVRRWKQLNSITIDVTKSPDTISLVSCYLEEAEGLYVDGSSLGTILLCAGIGEMVLSDQLTKSGMSAADLKRCNDLYKKINECHKLGGILDSVEIDQLHTLRKVRNDIIHANPKQLTERSKGSFLETMVGKSPTNYLSSDFGGSIEGDALMCLKAIRHLVVKFYGVEE